MIANNIFRAIGDFFTDFIFIPYDFFRFMNGWWISNTMGVFLVSIGFIFLFYWLGEMVKHDRAGEE
ncbi:MAG TPA: uracil phosphoribosyltransferase [Flavobacteriaceae bacterium]|jgi:uncharacterized membrane protein|nr:uracil phosphoribosyltransferase [Flavobacteriaceae bacterium]HBS12755.1 uracil phosphoribosyltransferase [Flavobacteriaceae bacterium]